MLGPRHGSSCGLPSTSNTFKIGCRQGSALKLIAALSMLRCRLMILWAVSPLMLAFAFPKNRSFVFKPVFYCEGVDYEEKWTS
jgi:hypothetical protein